MKYHFRGIIGTDDDELIRLYTIKEPQVITSDQMNRIVKILEEEE